MSSEKKKVLGPTCPTEKRSRSGGGPRSSVKEVRGGERQQAAGNRQQEEKVTGCWVLKVDKLLVDKLIRINIPRHSLRVT